MSRKDRRARLRAGLQDLAQRKQRKPQRSTGTAPSAKPAPSVAKPTSAPAAAKPTLPTQPSAKSSTRPAQSAAKPSAVAKPAVPRVTSATGEPAKPVDPVERRDGARAEARLREEHGRLVEMLRVERERNRFYAALKSPVREPRILRSERRSGLREMVAVAMGSDWHVEEVVEPVKAGYRNEYNLTIADASIKRFFRSQVDLVQHHRASKHIVIRDMVCAFSGDLMSGYIHEELLEGNQLSPVETALWLRPRIRDGIATLLAELDLRTLAIPWSYGNHGRTVQKKRIATGAENSYEWMLGRMLQDDLADDKRVVFDVSPCPHQYVRAYDYTLHFHHGDSLKYAGGVGGLGIPLLKAVPAWDEVRYAHYHHVGHWHQLRDFGRALVNGSLIGHGPYSSWIRAPFEPPQQLFYLLDSKRGRCHTTPLWIREHAS